MPCWYYEKKELRNTPSIIDGLDYETECRYRMEGARFIVKAGTEMDLGYNTMATGVVFFHRFYMFHSFRDFPRYVTAACCLFLAGKVEETPKKCKDIIKTARNLLNDAKFLQFGDNPKEEVMTLERILLQTIKFDLQVEHPYQYLLKYAKCLKGNKEKLQRMVQMAWTFVNDSLCTTLCVQWEPEVIAVALMYLAGKLSKFEVVDWVGRTSAHLFWWDMFVEDVTMNLLEDICHQVLDLYSAPKHTEGADSPPLTKPTPVVTPKKEHVPAMLLNATSGSIPVVSTTNLNPVGKSMKPQQLPQAIPVIAEQNKMLAAAGAVEGVVTSAPPPPPTPPSFLLPPPGAPPPAAAAAAAFVTNSVPPLLPPPPPFPLNVAPPHTVTSFPPPNYPPPHGYPPPPAAPPFTSRPPNYYPPPPS